MEELLALAPPNSCVTNQVLYNPSSRGIEFDLLGWCTLRGIAVMAYSPVGQGGTLLESKALHQAAARHGVTPAQILLAWTMRHPSVIAIPKASSAAHVRDNARSREIVLTEQDLAAIDTAFPPPGRKRSLEMR
jgi:diketogulonate reductase-like aldo/keto reductase